MAQGNGSGGPGGPIVPREILSRTDLSSTDKLVFAYVRDMASFFAAKGGSFQMSMTRIAQDLGLCERSVRNSVATLRAANLLSAERRNGRPMTLNPGTDYRGTPARITAVPRQTLPDTPARITDHPGTDCRGTPANFADERTTGTNYRNELSERPGPPYPPRHDASDIRAAYSRAYEAVTKAPALLKPADLQVIQSAIDLGTLERFPDLEAEFVRTLRGLQSKKLGMSCKATINCAGGDWTKDEPHKRTAPVRREGDPFGPDPVTGRPYHPGA